ncbi:glycogenin glucosyltransferase [Coemansia sp. RSA 1646]|nr:glycogenin glucosyltransferase [Coemansia sp. RSA 1646]KAJ2215261.1 glycogenin glucosyltransferase [Coemansia sp. RSA 487]
MDGSSGDPPTHGVAAVSADASALRQPQCAYVTLVTSDSYVDGALVLLHSLRRALTPYSIVCLATPASLATDSLQRLRQHFDGVIETDLCRSSDNHALAMLGRPDLWSTLTKIQLWNPALFGAWDAICYLDADTLVRQPIDDMFSRLQTWRSNTPGWRQGGLISASPDTGWPDCFNSGVLLLAPGYECYDALVRRVAQKNASFDGADQGLLNEHFSDWATDLPYRRLPFLYNSTANVYYTYEPALQRFGHDVRVVHFIGVSKPWHWERTPGGQLMSDASSSERWRQLVNLWWCIHDEHVSGWKFWKGPFSKKVAFGKGYHHITKPVLCTLSEQSSGSAHLSGNDTDKSNGDDDGLKELEAHHKEVSDWDKDWSWAADRVHPLDYAYLTTHKDLPTQQPDGHSEPAANVEHHHVDAGSSDFPSDSYSHGQPHSHSCLDDNTPSCPPISDASYNEVSGSGGYPNCDDHGAYADSRTANVGPNDYDHSDHEQPSAEAPEWMKSQRPWEDVAREGWMHSEDYHPHTYDQAYVGRHVTQAHPTKSYEEPYDGQHEAQPAYTPIPLPANQAIYEATQVVLQPRDMHDRSERNHFVHIQSHEHGNSQQHARVDYGSDGANHGNEYIEYHHGHSNQTTDYECSQTQHQPQVPGPNRSTSASTASPLYFPQPKSPVAVNPVALWESSEEQSRRREWAEQLRSKPNSSMPNLGNAAFTHHTTYNAPESASVSGFDSHISVSTLDHIDSSQLPKETPWKISHVRQRRTEDNETVANTLQNSLPAGIQFKEGVANDGNAREAAGQILKRWNESVVARNLKPRLGSIGLNNITHSDAKVERGTDAIRLETTVSCEAENSNGERTVYRFTLSSTLDVGGVQQPTQPPVPAEQQQYQTGTDTQSVSGSRKVFGIGRDVDKTSYDDRYVVTDLHQPDNYQEPAMSRRSSFVQLPLNSTRAPHLALQPRLGTSDQFAEADARYWKLQRQLIDLEMSQQRSDQEARRKADIGVAGTDPAIGFSGGWANQPLSDLYDFSSPPTPTRKQVASGFNVPERRLARRSSAFSIADPTALAEQNSTYIEVASPDLQPKQNEQQRAAFSDTGRLGRARSRSSLWIATPDQRTPHDSSMASASYRQPPNNDPPKAECLKNSRSHSDLRRIATENSAQAAVSVGGDDDNEDSEKTVNFGANLVEQPTFVASSPRDPELDNDVEYDNLGDSEDDKQYMSAIGRNPTPFPRKPRDSPGSTEDIGIHTLGTSANSRGLAGLEEDIASPSTSAPPHGGSASFELNPAQFDAPSMPGSTPSTPGKQKVRPKIVWDDDDDGLIPPDNDKSLDAQWLRIIHGAPPPRAPSIVPAKGSTSKAPEQGDVSGISEKASQQAPTQDTDSDDSDKVKGEPTKNVSEKEPSPSNERAFSSEKAQGASSAPLNESKERGSEKNSRDSSKKQSQAGIFSLSPRGKFDPLSDSEADPTEDKLQERFWARAMKPSKSGSSTPYSPRRRKSVVEISSSISPKDLAEWMRWQGDNDSVGLEGGFSDTLDEPTAPKEPNQQQLLTPPSSKDENAGLCTLDSRLADTSVGYSANLDGGDSAYDIAYEGGDDEGEGDEGDDDNQLEIWHQKPHQHMESEVNEPDTLEVLNNQSGPDLGSASATRTTSVK